MIPIPGQVNVQGKVFEELKFKSNKNLYFYKENGKEMFLIYHKDSTNLKLTTRNYNPLLLDLIEGVDLKKIESEEEKKLIIKYINIVKAGGQDSNYIKNLRKISGFVSKEIEIEVGEGLGDPISLFEKLTLLTSAVKAGHNGLEEDIKKVSEELKEDELISQEVYDKYKNKYFKK